MKIDTNNIYLGDCLEVMKYIPDKSVDMILADLPYEITACKWDTVIPFNRHIKEINNRGKEIILYRDEYILQEVKKGKSYNEIANYFDNNAIDGLWDNYNRIIKDNGAIVLFGSQPFSSCLVNSNICNFRYELIWVKERPTNPLLCKKQFPKYHENILVFYKKQPLFNPQYNKRKEANKRNNKERVYSDKTKTTTNKYAERVLSGANDYIYQSNIINISMERGLHPTQKPVKLCELLIKTYTNKGEIVLDNCMGSGSTIVACINTNRKYIGIEKEPKYYETAKKRIESVTAVQMEMEV